VVAVDPADSSGVKSAHLQACYAPEPPKKSEEGSVDAPPKPDCSIQSDAKYVKKPRPHVTFDLGPFASILTSGGGIALMPTDKAANDQENWHLETYAKKNRAKHAIAIGALLEIKKVSVPPLSGITGPGGSAGISASGGGSSASGGVGGLSIGTNTGSQPGTSFAGQGGGLSAPVNTGTQTSAAPVALAPVVAVRYPGVWFLPLALLIGASFFGFALTKDVIVRRS
jgi:hypothetical protein